MPGPLIDTDVPADLSPDNIDVRPYKIGYSFREPLMTRTAAVYKRPYWEMDFVAQGPTQVKEDMWKSKKLHKYPTIWRRAAKNRLVRGLGDIEEQERSGAGEELPDFYELGAAPGPTEASVTDATQRSPFGQLMNTVLTGAQTVFQQQQQLQAAKAGYGGGIFSPFTNYGAGMPGMPGGVPGMYQSQQGMGMLGWGAIIIGGAAVAYYLLNK